jgi:pyruvate,water dikinase
VSDVEQWFIDTPASERYPVYSRANAGEVAPDPVSPLAATMVLAGPGEQGYRDAFIEAGTFRPDEFEADRNNCVAVFGGYLYLSMSLARIYGVRMPGMTPEMVDEQYYGDLPGVTPYAAEARPTDVDPEATARLEVYLQRLFTDTDLPQLRADREQLARLVAARPDVGALTDQELVDHARSFMPLFRRLFCTHILVSAGSGFGIGTVSGICAAIGKPDLAMTLFAGLGDVDSAAPSWALWDLSRMVAASPSLRATLADDVDGFVEHVEQLAQAGDEAAWRLLGHWRHFLERFASRGPNEWDLRSATWAIAPQLALVALRAMVPAPDHESPQARAERRRRERELATAEVRALLAGADEETRQTFEAALRCGQLYSAGRERSKTNCVALVHEMRLAMRELGRRMVERGVLDSVEQVFMLVERELDRFVANPASFAPVVREREQTYLALHDRVPPFVTEGAPAHWTTWPSRREATATTAGPGTVLSGIPGCPGVARGRARVVLDPGDPRGLAPGEVLVAPLTDPAWTPLFVPAAAVVVDVGAQVTHAVIVSRELGLPCVVSVTGASRSIPDGALVEVDGTAGTVTVISVGDEGVR